MDYKTFQAMQQNANSSVVMNTIKNKRKGVFTKMIWYSMPQVAKAKTTNLGVEIIKVSSGVVILGIKNSNRKINLGKTLQKPQNENWIIDDYVMYNNTTNKTKLRAYTTNNKKMKTKTTYFVKINGVVSETTKQDLLNNGYITPSYFNQVNNDGIFNIDINNVLYMS